MKGLCNSAAQPTAEIYEVQKYFNLVTERKVLPLLTLQRNFGLYTGKIH